MPAQNWESAWTASVYNLRKFLQYIDDAPSAQMALTVLRKQAIYQLTMIELDGDTV